MLEVLLLVYSTKFYKVQSQNACLYYTYQAKRSSVVQYALHEGFSGLKILVDVMTATPRE